MFQIDSLNNISQDSQIDSEKTIKTIKVDSGKDAKSQVSIVRIKSSKNFGGSKTMKVIENKQITNSQLDSSNSPSPSNIHNQKYQKMQRSLSPNIHRKTIKLDENPMPVKRKSLRQIGTHSPSNEKHKEDHPLISSFIRRSSKEKTNFININELMNQLKKDNEKSTNDALNSSSSSGSTKPPSTINTLNVISSRASILLKDLKKGKPINMKELGTLEQFSYRNEYISSELSDLADQLMHGESDIIKLSHQPLFKYMCQFNKNKSKIRKNYGLIDETEQLELILRILKYIGNQDTIFKKVIKIIQKELSPYLVPKDESELNKFQKYTHDLHQLSDEEQPYVSYSNYKQISEVLLKGIQYYEKQNYMNFSDLIEQKQTYNRLSEFHKKQMEAEWAEKEKIQYKEFHVEEIIKQRVIEGEKQYKDQCLRMQAECEQSINKVKEECQQKIGEYLKQCKQYQEHSNLMQQQCNAVEKQIQDIKDKIKMRRYNVLFQQIMQQSQTNYSRDVGIQCCLTAEAAIQYPSLLHKVKFDPNQSQRSLSPSPISQRRYSKYLPVNNNHIQS